MQTFLPYPSFAESAAVLDTPRLGKQRVEALQILRALLMPTYGWQRHPAVAMWRGSVPALTRYGLATADEWTARGFADSVRHQLLEFAPEVGGRSQADLAAAGLLPAWLGDPLLHESHRSRLVEKDPEHYAARFAGTTPGLDYHWPEPVGQAPPPVGEPLWVIRVDDPERWRAAGLVGMSPLNRVGRATPAWRAQLRHLEEDLVPGTAVGTIGADGARLHLARITGPLAPATVDGVEHVARAARFEGRIDRAALPVPALLQNPRHVFQVVVRSGDAAVGTR